MGAVYVATNDLGNKKVVKVLLPYASQHPQIRERFDREARAAAKLNGRPHIVAIDDVGRLPNGQQFLTMEFLHGRTLEAHLREHGRVSPHHAFMLLVQIARGLHELHSARIVHRDLKPGNVFLVPGRDSNPYYVVLIDLGIAHDATLVDSNPALKTQTGMAMGTPGYMAPEQFNDAGSVTASADIYALAIILFEMLVGVRPWDAPSTHMLYHLQQTQPPTIPPTIEMPEGWRRIIMSSLARSPEARPQSAYAFVAALASELPGDDRLGVQSGAQMMAAFARSLLNQAPPDGETVRVRGAAPGPMMWTPARLTDLPSATPPAGPLSLASGVPKLPVNERPHQHISTPTTLGAASGVVVDAPPQRRPRLLIVAVATVTLATFATFGLIRVLRSGGTQAEQVQRSDKEVSPASSTMPLDASVSAVVDATIDAQTIDAQTIVEASDAGLNVPSHDAAGKGSNGAKATSGQRSLRGKPRTGSGSGQQPTFDPDGVAE
ncbi:MAG: protein kinase [Kofleriaceae bacterium]